MQLFKKKEQSELEDILSVFTTIKIRLTNFLDVKSKKKVELESELTGIEAEIVKSQEILEQVRKLSGDNNE